LPSASNLGLEPAVAVLIFGCDVSELPDHAQTAASHFLLYAVIERARRHWQNRITLVNTASGNARRQLDEEWSELTARTTPLTYDELRTLMRHTVTFMKSLRKTSVFTPALEELEAHYYDRIREMGSHLGLDPTVSKQSIRACCC
jgi:hypothetical protein